AVEVIDRGGGQRLLAVSDHPHQVDPAARRVHLLAPRLVGRTRRQAEPTVDAIVEQAARRGHSPPTKRPGLHRPAGSKRCLSRCMIAKLGGGGPHGSIAARSAAGASSITSEPPAATSSARVAASAAAVAPASPIAPPANPTPSVAYQATMPSPASRT